MGVISVDQIVSTGDAVDFGGAQGSTITINAGVTVEQTGHAGGFAVFSNGQSDTTLFNSGTAYDINPSIAAVALITGSCNVNNAQTGLIYGMGRGLTEAGTGGADVVVNAGVIAGASLDGVFFEFGPASVDLTNSGYIFGGTHGVDINTFDGGATITNSGTITSATGACIFISTGATFVTQITNLVGGVIAGAIGGPAAISISQGMLHLTNQGTISGNIVDLDKLSDVIINQGTINGFVFLGGNSVFNGSGGKSGPIDVGGGNATVTGGSGADQFIFDSTLTGQITKITNFTPKQHDIITLSEADFANLGPIGKLTASHFDNGSAKHAHPEIVYTQSNGFLYYDSNGSAHGGLHHFATLSSHPVLTPAIAHASFIVLA